MLTVVASPPVRERTGAGATFLRFAACGGGVGFIASLVVPMLAGCVPWAVANAIVTVASTVLATELHARVTFGTRRHADLRTHLQAAGTAAAAYVVTSAAMLLMYLIDSTPATLCAQAVYLAASGLAGIGRFAMLRLYVFGTRPPLASAAPLRTAGAPPPVSPPLPLAA
ncbi:MAG: hypothetical protein HOQ24_04975 [Mycobacteriaceae bacterium]|nr:hypothetical protein [Mycobacteriaceae bacterium]